MQNQFEGVQMPTPPHSSFNLSHDWKGSLKMGKLVPVLVQEALPSDRFTISADALFRMMPMIAPPMQKIDIYFHAFFVPNRLLWPNWEKFIWGGQYGDVAPALPIFDNSTAVTTYEASSLGNYLGMPVVTAQHIPDVNCLRWAAYWRIWYDWYRDQNLQNVPEIKLIDGDNNNASGGQRNELEFLRSRAWEHDYFTSALPWVQKGPEVGVPIDFSSASITAVSPAASGLFNPLWRDSATGAAIPGVASGTSSAFFQSANNVGSSVSKNSTPGFNDIPDYYDPQGSLVVAGTGSTTINDLRSAKALQLWLEKNARGGSRNIEGLRIHFGVTSSDARLDRAEYLGGSKSVMSISEVLQTSQTTSGADASPQANMAGHGISVSGGSFANYQCEEHGYFMVILSIRPKTAYYNGLLRDLLKRDRLDYYFQEFAHLGEQPIYNAELSTSGVPADDMETFGYVPRFNEYRHIPSRICGQLATTLDFWHLARKFAVGTQVLNDDFIVCDPAKRIFAVDDPLEDEIVGHIIFKIMARRPIPMFGTPI